MDLQVLITGRIQQVEIPETLINQLLRDRRLNHTVQINNNSIVLSADNFKAEFSYHSHYFNNGVMAVNFCLHTIKPLYYSFGLQLINKKYPCLEYWKDLDGNKIITCHIDRTPWTNNILKYYRPYTDHLDIESVDCREGKFIFGLRKKSGVTEGDELYVQTKI